MDNQKKSWHSKEIVGLGLTSYFNDFSHEMTTAILPAFVESLIGPVYTPQAIGLITGFSNSVASLLKLWSGWLGDKITNYKPILIIGYILTPLFIGLIAFAKNIWQVLILRTLAWSGRGLREPIRDKWISLFLKPKDYGKGFGLTRALDTLGAISGPLVAYFAISYVSLNAIFLMAFIPGFFSVLSLILLTQEYNSKNIQKSEIHFFKQFKSLPSYFLYFAFIFLIFNMAHFDKTFLIFRAQQHLSPEKTSTIVSTGFAILFYAFFNVIRATGEYSVGFLSDVLNRKNLLAILGFGLFGLTCVGLIFYHKSILLWIAIFVFAGISTAAVTVLSKVYVADLLPVEIRGTGYGLIQTIEGFGQLASGIIFGGLWTFFSGTVAFSYAAILSFIAMILLLAQYKK